MRFDVMKLAITAAVTTFVCYSICSLFTLYYPEQMRTMTASLLYLPHIEELIPHWEISWNNFVSGSLQLIVWSFLFTAVFAWMYNWLIGPGKAKK